MKRCGDCQENDSDDSDDSGKVYFMEIAKETAGGDERYRMLLSAKKETHGNLEDEFE